MWSSLNTRVSSKMLSLLRSLATGPSSTSLDSNLSLPAPQAVSLLTIFSPDVAGIVRLLPPLRCRAALVHPVALASPEPLPGPPMLAFHHRSRHGTPAERRLVPALRVLAPGPPVPHANHQPLSTPLAHCARCVRSGDRAPAPKLVHPGKLSTSVPRVCASTAVVLPRGLHTGQGTCGRSGSSSSASSSSPTS